MQEATLKVWQKRTIELYIAQNHFSAGTFIHTFSLGVHIPDLAIILGNKNLTAYDIYL